MFGVGVDPLGEVLAAVRSLVAGFEVDGLDAPEAARVVERCAEAERLLAVLRGSAATTLEDKAVWRRGGGGVGGPAATDGADRSRQVHRRPPLGAGVDRHNIGRLSATMTADELARVMGEIDRRCGDIVEGAVRGRWFESWEAHRVDALVEMA